MAEYVLDLTKCKLREDGMLKKLGLLEIPINKGFHYWDYDVAEDEIDPDKLNYIREAIEASTLADPEIPDAANETNVACRKSLPIGFDADDLPTGAIIIKV